MKKYLLSLAFVGVSACSFTPEELCDREGQDWFKFGTQQDDCSKLVSVGNDYDAGDRSSDRDQRTRDPNGGTGGSVDTKHPDRVDTKRDRRNNGWGNGDQPAPTVASLKNNRAENSNRTQRNHGKGNPN